MVEANNLVNVDAGQFSLYLEVKESSIENFNLLNDQKYDSIRGISIKKLIYEKFDIHGIQIARIDLNYNRVRMIELLEKRGERLKLQRYNTIRSVEKEINELKLKQYHEEIIGAFITYESIADCKHATVLFN